MPTMTPHPVMAGPATAAVAAVAATAAASSFLTLSPGAFCAASPFHRYSSSSNSIETSWAKSNSSGRRLVAVEPQVASAGTRGSSRRHSIAVRSSSSNCDESSHHESSCSTAVSRRSLLLSSAAAATVEVGWTAAAPPAASAAEVAGTAEDGKTRNLPVENLRDIIAGDISERQYFVTGNLTKSIYRDDCMFQDPTNTTVGLDRYLAAVSILFDPAYSSFELLSINVAEPNIVEARWRLGGYLKFPWRPRVVPFEGSTRYVFDDEGLVELHDEAWGISPFTALLETFTPTFGPQKLL